MEKKLLVKINTVFKQNFISLVDDNNDGEDAAMVFFNSFHHHPLKLKKDIHKFNNREINFLIRNSNPKLLNKRKENLLLIILLLIDSNYAFSNYNRLGIKISKRSWAHLLHGSDLNAGKYSPLTLFITNCFAGDMKITPKTWNYLIKHSDLRMVDCNNQTPLIAWARSIGNLTFFNMNNLADFNLSKKNIEFLIKNSDFAQVDIFNYDALSLLVSYGQMEWAEKLFAVIKNNDPDYFDNDYFDRLSGIMANSDPIDKLDINAINILICSSEKKMIAAALSNRGDGTKSFRI